MKLGLFLILITITITINSIATTIVRTPVYPKEALDKCIEGFVKLSYELDKNHHAINIIVLDSNPTGVFEQVSITSLRKNIKSIIIENNKEPYEQTFEFKLENCKVKKNNK